MKKFERIKELTELLNKASYEYYNTGHPIMDDSEFDFLLDELQQLENEMSVIMEDSPTINAGSRVAKEQKKITHEHPMLSLAKVHSVEEVKKFLSGRESIASIKLDGLSVSATYINGKLTRLESRGNGEVGTDVMIHKNGIYGLPKKINHSGKYVIDGECIVTYDDFYAINNALSDDEKFSNPRNMASGALNLLDSNVSARRGLTFIAWNVIEDTEFFRNNMGDNLDHAKDLGFTVVPFTRLLHYDDKLLSDVLEQTKKAAEQYGYPMDGIVFSLADIEYGKSLGKTSHHFNYSIAYKYEDELYETTLTDIEWSTSKSGLVNPVAIFEPVDLDGAITTRATLHNISYIENLRLGIGDKINIYRANCVIPKVHDNLTRSNTWQLPDKCPCCGGDVEIHNENGSKMLHCTNPDCKAKLISKLTHAVSKNALNINGLSEATIGKFVNFGWLKSIKDIYHLNDYADDISKLDGFGKKSTLKLLESIENSRNVELSNFIFALSVPLIGKSVSKDIAKACANGNVQSFIDIMSLGGEYTFTSLNGFGEEMRKSLNLWWADNRKGFYELIKEFVFIKSDNKNQRLDLNNMTFVITGSLNHYRNRDELVSVIEQLGGKVSGSVSSKTNYLINNDRESNSSKNQKAKKLNVQIITEEEFINMIES